MGPYERVKGMSSARNKILDTAWDRRKGDRRVIDPGVVWASVPGDRRESRFDRRITRTRMPKVDERRTALRRRYDIVRRRVRPQSEYGPDGKKKAPQKI